MSNIQVVDSNVSAPKLSDNSLMMVFYFNVFTHGAIRISSKTSSLEFKILLLNYMNHAYCFYTICVGSTCLSDLGSMMNMAS